MSVEVAEEHGHHHDPAQQHQFQSMDQQNECYIVGMWSFLVTEIMFFGALFLAYTIYRRENPLVFLEVHHHLDVLKGGINTMVLLTSSLTMAMAVYHAQMKHREKQMLFITVTILFAFAFLIIKGFEWQKKFADHHVPGPNFHYVRGEGEAPRLKDTDDKGNLIEAKHAAAAPGTAVTSYPKDTIEPEFSGKAQLFFSLYFAMTGLHAFHVIIGILIMATLVVMLGIKHPNVDYYMPVELAGLYWHFVDIVWIFLFPLFYLIPGS